MNKVFSQRLKDKYEVQPDGCWLWTASKRDGYGVTCSPRNKEHRVHRLMYAHTYGPIPPWLMVMHECMNKSCINPGHLKLGTAKENAHYKDRCKLTAEQVESIREASHAHAVELAKEFGISPKHIYKLRRGAQW